MTEVAFKSPRDGSVLQLRTSTRYVDEVEFEVAVRTPWFSGQAPASTFMNGSPLQMFRAMAKDWQGWVGEKTWSDLESRVAFSARSDSTGHVQLTVDLQGQDYESRLRVVIEFEAGQLQAMASKIQEIFGASA
jgi:hypothetical protein